MQKTTVAVILSLISTAVLAPPIFAFEAIPVAIKQNSQPEAKKIQQFYLLHLY